MSSMVTDLGSLLHTLPSEQKNEVRKLEKVSLKLVKSECRELFNSVCVRENLLPNYSNIRLHDEATKREPITLKFCQQLVQRELENAQVEKTSLEKDCAERTASLRATMDQTILDPILSAIQINMNKLEVDTKLRMAKNFKNCMMLL